MLQNKYTEEEFWDDMSPKAQDVHNKLYEYMIKRASLVTHPKTNLTEEEWRTIVYNTALLAAWAIDDILPDTLIDSSLASIDLPDN